MPDPRRSTWLGRQMADAESTTEWRLWGPRTGRLWEEPHPSEILATRSKPGQALGGLYDEMERDAMIAAVSIRRADAVLSLPRLVTPGGPRPIDRKAADFVRHLLGETGIDPEDAAIPDFDTALHKGLVDMRGRGISFTELEWGEIADGPWAGRWAPLRVYDRPMRRFLFRRRDLHVRRTTSEPPRAPELKFLVMRSGSVDSPWGGPGLLDRCYLSWFVLKHARAFWAIFLERYAQPTPVGKYPRAKGQGDEAKAADAKMQQAVLAAAESFQTEQAIALPEDVELVLLEAMRSSNGTYAEFCDALRREIGRLFNGEVNTLGLRPGVGAFASDKVASEIRSEAIVADARTLQKTLQCDLVAPLVRINFGPRVAVPDFAFDTLELEDREQLFNGIAAALAHGVAVPERHARKVWRVPALRDGEPAVEGASQVVPAPPAADPPPTEEIADAA
ncbi:MAG: DUF935 family protein [Acidobacteriota bacterium]